MSDYAQHQQLVRKTFLTVLPIFKGMRLWEIATGQAYAKFSVINAIKIAIRTRNLMQAKKALIVIKYGKVGHSDITGVYYGIWIGIEIKTGNAVQSKEQKTFQKMIESCHGVYIVINDKSPIEDQIDKLHKIKKWAENDNS